VKKCWVAPTQEKFAYPNIMRKERAFHSSASFPDMS